MYDCLQMDMILVKGIPPSSLYDTVLVLISFAFSFLVVFFLRVVPPFLLMSPDSITALDSDNVQFNCMARGYPLPSVVWEKDGLPLQSGESVMINSSTDSVQLTRTSTLLLTSVGHKNAGNYTCIASNFLVESFMVVSPPAVLTVNCEQWNMMLVSKVLLRS